MINTGKRIRKYRIAAGLSQTQLAEMLNVSPQSISKWENAKAMPSIDLLPQLADCLNVTVDRLLRGSVSTSTDSIDVVRAAVKDELKEVLLNVVANL